jgi:hypothetical protein
MHFDIDDYQGFLVDLLAEGAENNAVLDWLEAHVITPRDTYAFLYCTALMCASMIRELGGAPAGASFGVVNAGAPEPDTEHVMSMVGAALNDDHDTLGALVQASLTWPEDRLSVRVGRFLVILYQLGHAMADRR